MKGLPWVSTALLLNGCFLAAPVSSTEGDGGAGCSIESCNGADDDCDGSIDEGFDLQTSREHCGACGAACADDVPNAASACAAGVCDYTCDLGFSDCDGAASNGCEARLGSPETCASCGDVCPAEAPFCLDGSCAASCPAERRDCGGSCVDTQLDPLHCGACGAACAAAPNSASSCEAGACGLVCDSGFADCDGALANGCEIDRDADPQNCGACGNVCPSAGGAAPDCVDGSCSATCSPGRLDCDGNTGNGCEVMTEVDPANCGGCGTVCPEGPNGAASCVGRVCQFECAPDFADCDADPSNGCEVDLRTDAAHCGTCGLGCAGPAGRDVSCVERSCVVGDCTPGFADCDADASGSCETALGTVDDCATCGDECSTYGECNGGVCGSGCASECGLACTGTCCEPGSCGAGNVCSMDSGSAGCPRHLDCRGASSCTTSCRNFSRCRTDCRGAASCSLSCTASSSCELDCRGASSCSADCQGSSCLVFCDAGPACNISCQGGVRTCSPGVFACGFAACP